MTKLIDSIQSIYKVLGLEPSGMKIFLEGGGSKKLNLGGLGINPFAIPGLEVTISQIGKPIRFDQSLRLSLRDTPILICVLSRRAWFGIDDPSQSK